MYEQNGHPGRASYASVAHFRSRPPLCRLLSGQCRFLYTFIAQQAFCFSGRVRTADSAFEGFCADPRLFFALSNAARSAFRSSRLATPR